MKLRTRKILEEVRVVFFWGTTTSLGSPSYYAIRGDYGTPVCDSFNSHLEATPFDQSHPSLTSLSHNSPPSLAPPSVVLPPSTSLDFLKGAPFKLKRGQVIISSTHPSLLLTPSLSGESITGTSSRTSFVFEAELHVLWHSTEIGVGGSGLVHIGCVRQRVKILKVIKESRVLSSCPPPLISPTSLPSPFSPLSDPTSGSTFFKNPSLISTSSSPLPLPESKVSTSLQDSFPLKGFGTHTEWSNMKRDSGLKMGDRGIVTFQFEFEPEWINLGDTVLFRDGRVKCVGKVIKIREEFSRRQDLP